MSPPADAACGGPPHGFDEDPATWRLLRSRPPARALAWVGAMLDGTVTAARPLRGGTSSATHRLIVTTRGGAVEKVVLRRYVRPELNTEEPDIAAREAHALQFTATLDVPTPQLLACDPTGDHAGVPAVLMSHLPGHLTWSPTDMDQWLARLAGLLPAIHTTTLPPPGTIRTFTPDAQDSYQPPAWARRPAVWRKAAEIFHGPVPPDPQVFLHGDFHPGNILWRRRAVSGVVDWQAASIGPACIDVSYCHGNLLCHGLEVADRFIARWEQISGNRHHPWTDIITIIGYLDGLRDDPPPDRFAIEDTLTRAVAELHTQ